MILFRVHASCKGWKDFTYRYFLLGLHKVTLQKKGWVYVVNPGTGTGTENRFLTPFGTVEPVPEE